MLDYSAQLMHRSFSECIKLGTARVHSCYHRVLNIITEDGLLSILSAEIPCAPKALQLAEYVDFLKLDILAGNQVSLFKSHISIENKMTIDISDVKLWNCPTIVTTDIFSSDAIAGIGSVNEFFLKNCKKQGAAGWYRKKLEKDNSMTEDIIDFALRIRIDDFVRGWCEGELAPVERLIGVGYGLTPSGDDFLCGFYFAFSCLLPDNMQLMKLRMKILSLKKQMSDISYQMIDTYFNGEGNEIFYRFLSAVLKNDVYLLPDIFKEILMFGSTSGTDIMVGILTGLSLIIPLNEIKKNDILENLNQKNVY